MLASLSAKWVLLRNPKTGTTALSQAFERHAQIRIGGTAPLKHLTYAQFREMFGDYFERRGCEVFVVVRHPVAVLQSWYRFRARPALADPAHKRHANYTGAISFAQFVREWAGPAPRPSRAEVSAGIDFCFDAAGALPAGLCYYRYEDLDRLADRLARKTGVTVDLAVVNASPERPAPADIDALAAIPRLAEALALHARIPFEPR